ncbi:MAG: hypothetical protein J3K34DRAFT_117033 [Monoraphidium minutum]|nr:MAG: hypothetical protein J3K34DRAFT_117033 [Monoraphidium minutum]
MLHLSPDSSEDLKGAFPSDWVLAARAPWFRNLVELGISWCTIEPVARIKGLAGCEAPALRRLSFSQCKRLGDDAAVELARLALPALERLSIVNRDDQECGWRSSPQAHLSGRGMTAMARAWGHTLVEIVVIVNSGPSGSEAAITAALAAARLPRLEALRLVRCDLPAVALAHVAGAPWAGQLTQLDLAGNPPASAEGGVVYATLATLGWAVADGWGCFAVAPLTSLRTLNLRAGLSPEHPCALLGRLFRAPTWLPGQVTSLVLDRLPHAAELQALRAARAGQA